MTSHVDESSVLRAHVATLEELLEVHERTALDVTQRLEAERERLQEIFENVPAAVSIITAHDWIFSFVNNQVEEIVQRGPLTGKGVFDVIPEVEAQGYLAIFEQVVRTGEPMHAREAPIVFNTDNGPETHYFNYAFVPIRDPSGNVAAILSHAIDVTEMTEARRAVESLVEDLRLVAEMSRAINTELSVEGVARVAADGTARILQAGRCVLELMPEAHDAALEIAAGNGSGAHTHVEDLSSGSGQIATLYVERDEPFNGGDRAIIAQISRLTAVAIERARAYEREHRIAEILQRSLLPTKFPDTPGIVVATRYRPGGTGEEVGGDWYDVIELPDGRVALVLGDVGGKGVPSASIMGQIRTAVRAYAMAGHTPTLVMAMADRLLQSIDTEHMVTMTFVALDTASGVAQIVSAGHPPPVVIPPDGAPEFLSVQNSLPFGIMPNAQFRTDQVKFADDSVLILYSDGLIERRERALDEGFAELLDAVGSAPEDLEKLSDHVLSQMLPDRLSDDVALLACRLSVLATGPLELTITSSANEIPKVRHVLERYAEAVGASPETAMDIVVAAAEACANAVEHGYAGRSGTIALRAYREDESFVVQITDRGGWMEPLDRPWRGRGLQMMRSLMDEVAVEGDGDGTRVTMTKKLRSRWKGATA